MSVYINSNSLTESVAVANLVCSNCLEDIEIGDECFIDASVGIEEHQAKIYCHTCIEDVGLR